MATEPNLDPQDVKISEVPRFTRSGSETVTQVRYYLGNQGPFMDEYAKGQFNPEAVKAAINKRAQDLRSLLQF